MKPILKNRVFKIQGNNVLFYRSLKKISQQELADKLAVDINTVYQWERQGKQPQPANAIQLCEFFKTEPEDLFYLNL